MSERAAPVEWVIKPQTSWLGVGLKELLAYKDLLFRLVRREFLVSYQQTLLGPFWAVGQPVLTVLTYIIIFNKVIGISTNGTPPFLFYFTGIILWNLFSDILNGTSNSFINNAYVFSKVYFPRIIMPLSVALLHLLRFSIQLLLLVIVLFYFFGKTGLSLHMATWWLCIPAVIITAGIAFGVGLIFSIVTAMYRDLLNVIGLIIRLFMFVCPIFYSQSMVPQQYRWLAAINPLSPQFELFRYAFLGKGVVDGKQMVYSILIMITLVTAGLLLFNKKGDKLIDVI